MFYVLLSVCGFFTIHIFLIEIQYHIKPCYFKNVTVTNQYYGLVVVVRKEEELSDLVSLFLLSNLYEYDTEINIIENSTSPSPRCIVTRTACNRSIITIAPRLIWPIAAQLATIKAIFIPFGLTLDLNVKAVVTNTNNAVVAATDL
jgi:hypothetical protein